MGISFEYYKIFYNVAKYGKLSLAAEKLYVSQPAVTQAVQKLEEQIGAKLFFRTKYGMELTYEGKALYEYLKDSIANMENAEKFFSKFIDLDKGELRIGGGDNLMQYFIKPIFDEFIKTYPHINVSLVPVRREDRLTKLLNNDIDISVLDVDKNEKGLENIEITKLDESDKYVFIVSKKFIEKNNIKCFEDLKNPNIVVPHSKHIDKVLREYMNETGFEYSTKYELDSSSRLFDTVLDEVGVGLTGKIYFEHNEYKKDELVALKEFTSISACVYVATLKKELCNRATIEFTKKIKEHYGN